LELPFPFLDSLPADRFPITEGKFTYVGRERFREVCEKVQTLQYESSIRRLYVPGSMGYRKSQLLAALVCLLIYELSMEAEVVWDYSLIRTDKGRTGRNEVNRIPITMSGKIRDNGEERIGKIGRTTGWTEGNCEALFFRIGGLPRFPGRVTRLHGVLKCSMRGRFLEEGDSGGLVDSHGIALAICQGYGSPDEGPYQHVELVAVLPVADILERIEKKFGMSFSLSGK
jgi:hypothetical protein